MSAAVENVRAPSPARAAFDAWAAQFKACQRVALTERAGAPGWWRGLPESLRCFLLSEAAPDEWERYAECEWPALPAGLRACIAAQSRGLVRSLSFGPWQ